MRTEWLLEKYMLQRFMLKIKLFGGMQFRDIPGAPKKLKKKTSLYSILVHRASYRSGFCSDLSLEFPQAGWRFRCNLCMHSATSHPAESLRSNTAAVACYGFVQARKKSKKIKFLGPETARWGGGLPREGVVAENFVPALETLSSLGFEERNPGCPGNFAGMSRTPGGVQKVRAKKLRAHFSFPICACFKDLSRSCFTEEEK